MTKNKTSQAVAGLIEEIVSTDLTYSIRMDSDNKKVLFAITEKYNRMEEALTSVLRDNGAYWDDDVSLQAAKNALAFDPLTPST